MMELEVNLTQGSQEPVAPIQERKQETLRVAVTLFQQKPDWVTFFREVLGVDGVARKLFKTKEDMADFEQSSEFREIQQMVAKLREQGAQADESKEPTRVITVRLPKCLHEALREEAGDRKTSMNQLCISKLLQMIEDDLIPTDGKSGEKKAKKEKEPIQRIDFSAQPADAFEKT